MLKEEGRNLKDAPVETIFKNLTSDIYNASWNVAWTGDKIIRMMSYHNLRARGYSARDAAEQAALAHADYADVPAPTRHILGVPFFTPTFQISMAKWFAGMYSAPFKIPADVVRAVRGGDKEKTKLNKDLLLTMGAATMTALWYARDYVLTDKLGWEKEEFNRKYKKLIKYEEDGKIIEKEVVLTLSDPTNIPQKYYYTFIKNKPGMTKSEQIAKYGKFWLHPVLKIGADLKDNKKPDGAMIMNPFHSGPRQMLDAGKYIARNTFRLYGDLLAEDNETKKEAFAALKKSGDHWANQLFRPIAFVYLRDPEVERVKYRVNALYTKFIKTLKEKPPATKDELAKMESVFMKQINELEENIKDTEVKEYIKNRGKSAEDIIKKYSVSVTGKKMSRKEAEEAIEKAREKKPRGRGLAGIPDIKGDIRRDIRKSIKGD